MIIKMETEQEQKKVIITFEIEKSEIAEFDKIWKALKLSSRSFYLRSLVVSVVEYNKELNPGELS